MAAPRDHTYNDGYSDNVPLGSFLSRPVQIVADDWVTNFSTSTYTTSFDPWTLWQNDARVKAKIQNFAYASFDMKLRFVVNGSPFQYGRLMIVYIPYGELGGNVTSSRNQVAKQMELWGDSGNGSSDGAHEARFRHFSTYPHAFLNPSSNQVVEMKIPFIWHNNFIAINGVRNGPPKETLGTILLLDVNPLRVANLSTPVRVRYHVYAWAENLKLTMPTEFVPTGNTTSISLCCCKRRTKEEFSLLLPDDYFSPTSDEYNDGPVSQPASAIAAAAGKLTKAPIIGAFARATEIGASAAGNIASVFGFSAPPMVQNPERYLHRNHGRLANTAGEDSSYTLSLDPKQEITVDPRTVGVAAEDEMAISSIVSREQWIARAEWRGEFGQFTTPGVEKILFASLVSPNQQHHSTVGSTRCVMDCPAGHVANMFEYWKGSITYRVEVVCTPYHSGRLKLQFDPMVRQSNLTASTAYTDDINARYTTIMDLAEDTSVEFTIDYNSRYPWLRCLQDPSADNQLAPTSTSQTSFNLTSSFSDSVHMGMFTVSVVNDLVAPIATDAPADAEHAPVQVNVYMKCGSDFQFAQPNEVSTSWSVANFKATSDWTKSLVFVPTSDTHDAMPTAIEHNVVGSNFSGYNNMVFFGESVSSIRSLIKRYSLVFTGDYNNDPRNQSFEMVTRIVPHIPAQVTRGKIRRNSFLTYMSPCYLIQRGSTRYKFTYYDKGDNGNTSSQSYTWFERLGLRTSVKTVDYPVQETTTMSSAALDSALPHGYQGSAFTDNTQQSTLEVQLPFYSNTRFMLAAHFETVSSSSGEPLIQNPTMKQILAGKLVYTGRDAHANVMQQWHAAGDDFSLHFFTGVPGVFISSPVMLYEATSSLSRVSLVSDGQVESTPCRLTSYINVTNPYHKLTKINYAGFRQIFDSIGVSSGGVTEAWWIAKYGSASTATPIAQLVESAGGLWTIPHSKIIDAQFPTPGQGLYYHWLITAVNYYDVETKLLESGINYDHWVSYFSTDEFVPIANIYVTFTLTGQWTKELTEFFTKAYRTPRYLSDELDRLYAKNDLFSWRSHTLSFAEFDAINDGTNPSLNAAWWDGFLLNGSIQPISMIKFMAGDKWTPAMQAKMLQAYPT